MNRGDAWTVNTSDKLAQFLRYVQEEWKASKWLEITVRSGQRRSRSQEALWAIWCREWIAPFMGWGNDEEAAEKARLAMYSMFLGVEDIVVSEKLTITGQLRRFPKDHAEAYHFMSQVQEWWMSRGLLLESSGEFLENQQREVA